MRELNLITCFILLVAVQLCYCENSYCEASDGSSCNSSTKKENKYIQANGKFAKYLNAIEEAEKNYISCNEDKCNCHMPEIKKDLKPFQNGITKNQINDVKVKGTKYQIINNRLYRQKDCMFPARCAGIEHFLLSLLPKLPDMELIVNTRDWPQIYKQQGLLGPVFSFSKTDDHYDIMYPAWAFWEGGPAISLYPRGIGRWDKHRIQLAEVANKTQWEDKKQKGFFRGSRTSSERDNLILLSRRHPKLVDAQYTKNQAWKSDADTLHQPPASEVTFEDHCKYKFLFNFRGVAASFRFKHVLLCKSLVFHVGDEWQEFFYAALKPWIHYVPVKSNASQAELKELLDFFQTHDDIAKKIAENGFNMIWNNLKMNDVSCYWSKLLKKYAKLLKYDVELDTSLIEIKPN